MRTPQSSQRSELAELREAVEAATAALEIANQRIEGLQQRIATLEKDNAEMQLKEASQQEAAARTAANLRGIELTCFALRKDLDAKPTLKRLSEIEEKLRKDIEQMDQRCDRMAEMQKEIEASVAAATSAAAKPKQPPPPPAATAQPWKHVGGFGGLAKQLRMVPTSAQLPAKHNRDEVAREVLAKVVKGGDPVQLWAVRTQEAKPEKKFTGALVLTMPSADASRILMGLKGGIQPTGWRIYTHLEAPELACKKELLAKVNAPRGTKLRFADNMRSVTYNGTTYKLSEEEVKDIYANFS
jgi:hypothetical protein